MRPRLNQNVNLILFKIISHRVRDKTDELAKVFKAIADSEHHNPTTKKALDSMFNGFSFLADHQSLEMQRIEEKVIQDLSQYQLICQNAKEEVKNQIMLRDREVSKRKQLDLNRRAKNENEVILSNMQISKILKEVATISEQFEKQKLADFKEGLTNLLLIELKYHARCLEVLTLIHEDVSAIDESQDVEVTFNPFFLTLDFSDFNAASLISFLCNFKGFMVQVKKVNRVQVLTVSS